MQYVPESEVAAAAAQVAARHDFASTVAEQVAVQAGRLAGCGVSSCGQW